MKSLFECLGKLAGESSDSRERALSDAMRATENVISLKNSLFAGNLPGDKYEQHSRPSQAVRGIGQIYPTSRERPVSGGLSCFWNASGQRKVPKTVDSLFVRQGVSRRTLRRLALTPDTVQKPWKPAFWHDRVTSHSSDRADPIRKYGEWRSTEWTAWRSGRWSARTGAQRTFASFIQTRSARRQASAPTRLWSFADSS
jgi:hypothetical protein